MPKSKEDKEPKEKKEKKTKKAPKGPKKEKGAGKKREKKDPNAPKGVRGPYILFSQEQRPIILKAHPDWKVTEVSKELGRRWGELDDNAKKPYVKASEKDKLRYQKEMEAYQGK